VAQIWEEQTDNFAMLPIFRGLIQKSANKNGRAKWLSVFNEQNRVMKEIFKNYKLVSSLFNEKISKG
jgi:hypothetical protein